MMFVLRPLQKSASTSEADKCGVHQSWHNVPWLEGHLLAPTRSHHQTGFPERVIFILRRSGVPSIPMQARFLEEPLACVTRMHSSWSQQDDRRCSLKPRTPSSQRSRLEIVARRQWDDRIAGGEGKVFSWIEAAAYPCLGFFVVVACVPLSRHRNRNRNRGRSPVPSQFPPLFGSSHFPYLASYVPISLRLPLLLPAAPPPPTTAYINNPSLRIVSFIILQTLNTITFPTQDSRETLNQYSTSVSYNQLTQYIV